MTQIDLSALNSKELRRLLDSARRQGQPAQTLEILREMAARRERGTRTRPPRRGPTPGEPRIIALDFGDPLEPHQEPFADEGTVEEAQPLSLDPTPYREEPEPPPRAQRSQGWAHWGALIFAVGLAGGTAVGWWAAGYARHDAAPAQQMAAAQPRPAQLPVETPAAASPTPPPSEAEPALVPQPTPPAPTEAAAPQPSAPAPETDASASVSPAPAAAAPPAETESPSAQAKVARMAKAEPVAKDSCASQPTPADKTICESPKLRRLQGELRTAYAEALKAHQDRALLRERELAWRDARNSVTDPQQLAKLYETRIEKLKAATADALRQR